MSDINRPTPQDKNIQHIFENIQDKTKLVEEAFFDSPPIRFLSDGHPSLVAPIHSHKMLNDASNALRQNDIQEAAHQLRREVDFCNAVAKMAGSPYEKSGKAALEALDKHKSVTDIDLTLKEAWNKAWAENPAPFYDISGAEKRVPYSPHISK